MAQDNNTRMVVLAEAEQLMRKHGLLAAAAIQRAAENGADRGQWATEAIPEIVTDVMSAVLADMTPEYVREAASRFNAANMADDVRINGTDVGHVSLAYKAGVHHVSGWSHNSGAYTGWTWEIIGSTYVVRDPAGVIHGFEYHQSRTGGDGWSLTIGALRRRR